MSSVAFLNPPLWDASELRIDLMTGRTGGTLRQGIRAGSRWPFTRQAQYAPDQFRFGSYLPFPFFLASAAAWCAKYEDRVVIRDSIARGESYQKFFEWLKSEQPTHIVIETGAVAIDHDLKLIDIIRKLLPGVKVAIAGPVAATLHGENRAIKADAYLCGEYEKNATRFVAGSTGLLAFDLLTKEEMDALPYPMFDEEVALNYWDSCPDGQKPPQLQLLTSRGCPHKCCFCAWPATMTGNDPDGTKPRAVRFHTPEWVDGFIRHRMELAEQAGAPLQCAMLDDDTLNLNEKHTKEISGVMAKIGIPWVAMCRADTISRETWQLMRDSGCIGVKIGFESGVQRVVDEIVNKKLNLADAAETCRFLRKIGLTVHGTFTIGLPGETKEEEQATRDFIKMLYDTGALDTHQLSGTATIEGTPLAAIARGEHLKKFPGADGSGYVANPDGQHKAEDMR